MRSTAQRAWMRRQFWTQIRYQPEAWSEDWEAAERVALRQAFGLIERLERVPRVADDADLVWQPSADHEGRRPWHKAMWPAELRRADRAGK